MKNFIKWLKSSSSDYVLFLVLVVLLNIAGVNTYKRFDLTAQKSYSLSKESKNVVKNLEEPLTVRVFFDDNLPAQYANVAQYVKDILVEYDNAGNRNFKVAYMDMKKPENVKLAQNYGLRQIQIQEVKNNEVGFKQGYLGLAIIYGDNIDLIDPVTSPNGFEFNLTKKISKMINTADSLASLKNGEKLSLTLYLSDSLQGMRINGFNQVEKTVKDVVYEINKQVDNRIDFKCLSPDSAEAAIVVNRYGIQGINYQDGDGNKKLAAVGLVLEYKDNFKVIPLQIQNIIFGYAIAGLDEVEENLNQAIQGLFSHVTSVGYVTGHGEQSLEDRNAAQNFQTIISESYELKNLNLAEEDIPAGMNSIVINGPKEDFTDDELYKIDQFVMRGGNVMFFVDPLKENPEAQYGYGEPFVPNECNVEKLLTAYGAKVNKNYVFDKNCYTQNNGQYGKLNYYWAPVLQKDQMAKKHPVTANLGYVIMIQNGSVDVSGAVDNKNVKVTTLAKSSKESWTAESGIMLHPLYLNPPADTSKFAAENLAVLLEGKFQSAFTGPVEEEQKGELSTSNFVSTSVLPGKIFVIGSSAVTTAQVIDSEGDSPVAMFLMNIVDYMNGNVELCKMRTKSLLINTLNTKNGALVMVAQMFNEFGLVIILLIVGFIIWRKRSKRRKAINAKYNPNDERTIKKSEK
ncbi:MAG: Gldg family protein [Treponema sp.]|nr:Gldg family protein [Treponema sp.]